jgi:hypothetical protein
MRKHGALLELLSTILSTELLSPRNSFLLEDLLSSAKSFAELLSP